MAVVLQQQPEFSGNDEHPFVQGELQPPNLAPKQGGLLPVSAPDARESDLFSIDENLPSAETVRRQPHGTQHQFVHFGLLRQPELRPIFPPPVAVPACRLPE